MVCICFGGISVLNDLARFYVGDLETKQIVHVRIDPGSRPIDGKRSNVSAESSHGLDDSFRRVSAIDIVLEPNPARNAFVPSRLTIVLCAPPVAGVGTSLMSLPV